MRSFFFSWTRLYLVFFFFQAEDGIRDADVTGVQTCALPISAEPAGAPGYAHAEPGHRELRSDFSAGRPATGTDGRPRDLGGRDVLREPGRSGRRRHGHAPGTARGGVPALGIPLVFFAVVAQRRAGPVRAPRSRPAPYQGGLPVGFARAQRRSAAAHGGKRQLAARRN